jgi:sterol-4alpha-carboxylate 3-dehydrogenase (decarboxylating)
MATCSVRPAVICGPGDYQLVTTIQKCIDKLETPFVIGDGGGLYDFIYVGNVADAHVLAVHNLLTTRTAAGEAFLITNGSPIPFRAFCLAIWAHFGHVPPFELHIPKPVAWAAAWAMEWVTWLTGRDATLSRGSVKDYCQHAYANIDKARRILGYEPRVSLADGLKMSCDVCILSSTHLSHKQGVTDNRNFARDLRTRASMMSDSSKHNSFKLCSLYRSRVRYAAELSTCPTLLVSVIARP